jgi:hypothetical protein
MAPILAQMKGQIVGLLDSFFAQKIPFLADRKGLIGENNI